MVLADSEHYSTELFDHIHLETPFELLVPMPPQNSPKLRDQTLAPQAFTRRWAGYATTKAAFRLQHSRNPEPYYRFVQRNGERPEDYYFKSFLATLDRDEVQDLTVHGTAGNSLEGQENSAFYQLTHASVFRRSNSPEMKHK